MQTQTNNSWTNVSLEQLHQRLAFNNSELLSTDDHLLNKHTLAYKNSIKERLNIIWNTIHPPKLEGRFFTVLELLELCSKQGFEKMLVEKNVTENTFPDTNIYISEEELIQYQK